MNLWKKLFGPKKKEESPQNFEEIHEAAKKSVADHLNKVAKARWPEKSGFSQLYDKIILDLSLYPMSDHKSEWKDVTSYASMYSEEYTHPNLPYSLHILTYCDQGIAYITDSEELLNRQEKETLYDFIRGEQELRNENYRKACLEESRQKMKKYFPDLED